ncbi:MAG: ECF transporter S component [Clostridia bacterium]|nr:ECF transporter S component [Clostridia bacterium]
MRDDKLNKLIMTALMISIVTVSTMFIKIPTLNGYIHLGDTMVFFSVFLLGKKHGAAASGIGSALGDVLGGYAIWAPWTFVIKSLMALIFGVFLERSLKSTHTHKKIANISIVSYIGMILAGLEMCVGYYIANGIIYGNWLAALAEVIPNIGQFSVGIFMSVLLVNALRKHLHIFKL